MMEKRTVRMRRVKTRMRMEMATVRRMRPLYHQQTSLGGSGLQVCWPLPSSVALRNPLQPQG